MQFADRTNWTTEETAWSRALEARRQSGLRILDLTASNPTQCGFFYEPNLLAELSAEGARTYDPDPRGMMHAREAVCGYYADHGAHVDPEQVVLTTSTSEGYSWLFRLLCDFGDEVLIAQPSYPLFDLLATMDDVRLAPYALLYDPGGSHGWSLDLHALRERITSRARAIIVVHPNNPTGHFTTAAERAALTEMCRELGIALIVDEVFLDYSFPGHGAQESFARREEGALTFVLSGLSKVAALPQIGDRVQQNLETLDAALAAGDKMARLACEGGWYATLRTPSYADGEALAIRMIERHGVAVHPGNFFGFREQNRVVLSLLTLPEVFAEGIARLIAESSLVT